MSSKSEAPNATSEAIVEYASEPAAAAPNPLVQAHALLRGRYWLAIALGLIGMIGGAVAGYFALPPTYTSTGLIRIKPSLPRVLYQSDQNSVMPMFDAFVGSQVALLTDQRTQNLAMNNPDWKALGRSARSDMALEFSKSLTANHPSGTELIYVTFTDRDPSVARIGVASTIRAYEQLYGENDANSVRNRLGILDDKKNTLLAKQKEANQRVADLAGTLGPSGLKQVYDAKLQQMTVLGAQLQQSRLALALASGDPTTRQSDAGKESLEVMAIRYPEIGRLLTNSRQMAAQLSADRALLGPQHRTVLDEKARLDSIDGQLADTVKVYRQLESQSADHASAAALSASGKSIADLRHDIDGLQKLLDETKKDVDELGAQYAKVAAAQADADEVKSKLDEVARRMEEMSTETTVGGRISIESYGDVPLEPTKDKRIALASVGGLGAGGLAVALVMLLGLMDRRVRHITDVQSGQCRRILGVLPLLPGEEADPEQAMIAAHGVHQIRMLLERPGEQDQKTVIAITSASPGAGKTSLTLALGLSFAASGARTLLMDCDIIGGGLTAKMKHTNRRRLGHVLRRLGLITTEQLVTALKESRRLHEPIGQVLVRKGIVTVADVEHALEVQQHTLVGLREALAGDPANECVTGAGSQNLFLMPLGSARREHASQLSIASLRRVVDQVRNWFDVVLIDTGPLLGSLEARAVAMAADQVVLTVAPGEQRPLIDRAIRQLEESGAQLAGLVLNRAQASDLAASEFSSSASRRSKDSREQPLPELHSMDHEYLRLGPIGGAVLALGDSTAPKADEQKV